MNALNICIDELPDTLDLDGHDVPIRTSFRIGMLFEMMIESRELDEQEMLRQAFELWFEDKTLAYIAANNLTEQAVRGMMWFYSCGKVNGQQEEQREKKQKKEDKRFGRRIYDFDIDAPLIYAAFRSQYGIDLQDDDLHWWKFSALFSGLNESEQIVKVMGYRAVNVSSIKNKDERQRMAKLQSMYALPDHRTNEEKAKLAGAIFGGMT